MVQDLTAEKPKIGRPTVRTEEAAKYICDGIATGRSLRSICQDEDVPDLSTISRWLAADENFRKQYARARNEQADYFADEIVDISDKAKDRDSAAVAKVRIDARIWHASKTNRTKYGDRPTETNITTNVQNVVVFSEDRRKELMERKAQALRQLPNRGT